MTHRPCKRCQRDSKDAELDDCLHCGSVDLCPACMIAHVCWMRAKIRDRLTIARETR